MNVYRMIGDGSHVLAICIILLKLLNTRSAAGLSGKSFLLFALTYTFRYFDLLTNYISEYNTLMKCFYITTSWLICYLLFYPGFINKTYQKDKDTFRIEILLLTVTALAFFIHYDSTWMEIAWTWSIYMESIALLPQFWMIWKTKKLDGYIVLYVLFMAIYRGFYIGNWVYRYHNEGYYDPIAFVSGCVETIVGALGNFVILFTVFGKSCGFQSSPQSSIYLLPSAMEHATTAGKEHQIMQTKPVPVESKDTKVLKVREASNKYEKYLEGPTTP